MEQREQKTFSVEVDENRIAIVRILPQEGQANWLPLHFIEELRSILGTIIYQQARGVIFTSEHPHHFIQGIKPALFQDKTTDELKAFSRDAQNLMREFNTLKMPVVAAISGNCFSIGLELALACDYRIATEDKYTLFAMPQIRSGILPFAGGTQRLPRLIGLAKAAPILLSGHKISATKALKIGLVNKLVPSESVFETAYRMLLQNQIQKVDPKKPLTFKQKWRKQWEGNLFYRNYFLDKTENNVWQHTFGNYPAVSKLIELLKEPHFRQGLELEQEAFAELSKTEQSQALINLMKTERHMRGRYDARAKVGDIAQVSVLGSGYMGAGIAYITAYHARIPVRIKDIHPSEIQKALRTCFELMRIQVDKKQLKIGEMTQRLNLITGGERLVAAKSTNFVIEAVYEDLKLKQKILQDSEQYYSENTIFATQTATLSVADIAQASSRPENVIGIHYISPITRHKMVEIIPHSTSSEHTIATAIHFVIQQGKVPMLVVDKKGFFVNRVLMPFLLEALECLNDGEAIEFIDRALQEFGFQTGPLALIDEMGLDVLVKSSAALVEAHGKRFMLPDGIDLLIRNERKGCKNKRGFYMYDSKGARLQEDKSIYHVMEIIANNDLESEQIARRCLLRMINEACWALQDNIIAGTDEGNVASVLAMGFPEFRGGIYRYIEQIGAKEIVRQLRLHAQQYGYRFEPCLWLVQEAEKQAQTVVETVES